MQTYEQTTCECVRSNPPIYVLLDERGNLIGAGSLDILEVVHKMSHRCVTAICEPPSTLTSAIAPHDSPLIGSIDALVWGCEEHAFSS